MSGRVVMASLTVRESAFDLAPCIEAGITSKAEENRSKVVHKNIGIDFIVAC